MKITVKIIAVVTSLFVSLPALACDVGYVVNLKTLGQTVNVELREGAPGRSSVVERKRSSGGRVLFNGLCPGNYFLAIGDSNDVQVTPVRAFDAGYDYESEIRLQTGHGNVDRKKRSSL